MVFDIVGTITSITHSTLFVKYGIAGLFLNSALSPVIPIPTEIAVSALVIGEQDLTTITIVLAAGSIIGSLFGYFIGYSGNRLFLMLHRTAGRKREHKMISKYGWVIILLSPWMPFMGNAIVILAGNRKHDFKEFSISIAAGQVIKAAGTVYLVSLILPHILKRMLT